MEKFIGLTNQEVTSRLQRDGFNELPSQKPKSFINLLVHILVEPMIFLLLAAGIIYFMLGEPRDAVFLLGSIFVVIGITFYQEHKTERALQALRDLSSPRALVIRNGEQIRIPGKEVVVDDVIVLQEGDRVPADAFVVNTQSLLVDESLLTGESLPVQKSVWKGVSASSRPNEDNSFTVFAGTLIAQGSGVAKVVLTGVRTEMGKIGKSLVAISDQDSLLKKEIGRMVRVFGVAGLTMCLALVVIKVVAGGDILNAFLAGLTLSMSMLPEEFPVVLLIFLTLGAWRISKKQVLTRNNQAIETLGATTVLCVDKTGTLTFNRMELTSLISPNGDEDIATSQILEYAKLASKRNAFDPLEKEINTKYQQHALKGSTSIEDWHLLKEYPLSGGLFAVTRVWKPPIGEKLIVACKGAPEAVMGLCGLGETDRNVIMGVVGDMSKKGQRVLGVAKAAFVGSDFPSSADGFSMSFLGLIGFADPLRPAVPASVQECYQAGIRTIMITGDYPGTAQFIAAQAGIRSPHNYLTGAELEKLSKDQLKEKIKEINVFARIVPEQKLLIVEALKANGEIVAMTGDGVNDGPALKAAHIGIAMGERGTDVARESADLVLLDDDFTSIVSAIKVGRRIYDNLQKAASYIFSVHIPIAGVALMPTLLGFPAVLFPVHIAFLELIIDPACSTVFESEEPEAEIMRRLPRKVNQALLGRAQIVWALLNGLALLASVLIVYIAALQVGKSEGVARSMAFVTLVLCNLLLIITNLSRESGLSKFKLHKNRALLFIAGITIALLVTILAVPFLQVLFHFSALDLKECFAAFCLVSIYYVWLELIKLRTVAAQTNYLAQFRR